MSLKEKTERLIELAGKAARLPFGEERRWTHYALGNAGREDAPAIAKALQEAMEILPTLELAASSVPPMYPTNVACEKARAILERWENDSGQA